MEPLGSIFLFAWLLERRHGARPLQRTIERRVVTPLARWLVEHPEIRGRGTAREVALDLDDAGQQIVVRAGDEPKV